MRILQFAAKRVHNRYDYDMEFNEEITFLVGINGSGKTTSLRLLQAMLAFDLTTLLSIKFSELRVVINSESKFFDYRIISDKKNLVFVMNGEDLGHRVARLDDEKLAMYSKVERIEGYVEDQRVDLIQRMNQTFPAFMRLGRPLFLGLERRAARLDIEPFYFDEDVGVTSYSSKRSWASKGIVEGLDSSQFLIERAFRKYRKASDSIGARLTNTVVGSMFDYIEFNPDELQGGDRNAADFRSLYDRRREIEALAARLGGSAGAEKQISEFFSKMQAVLEQSRGAASIEWLMNRSQIKRIHKLLEEMERQKTQAERFYVPIENFLDGINSFLRDSRKVASVDSIGKLKVTQEGVDLPLSSLSSGEKQLLIMLAHAWFGRGSKGVLIVDEPELSLHLRWQERLVDEISKGAKSQMIFATHSPEIIGFKKNNCVYVG
ncbi:AAA family ATPase [Stenotrophomonas sp. 364]|uniref:AAA family ATPase n=1 Tax=Stenotrophomonas sp. 364 TaxID=2691571 RepID=UPI00131970CD|nr:AAA family ATPase [Stenotrophomonas sp. 364]QHB69911.1 AAA family ATPase [Stenotrophomonas sp. 364]